MRLPLAVAALLACVPVSPPPRAECPRYGAMLDLGIPSGAVASFAYRPHQAFGSHIGVGHNTSSPGLRGGLHWAPLTSRISPYLALEAGYYREARAPSWLRRTARRAGLNDKTLARVGYQYASEHLGLRFGSAKLSIYLQMGMSFVRGQARVIEAEPNHMPPIALHSETTIHAWLLSGRGGIVYYF